MQYPNSEVREYEKQLKQIEATLHLSVVKTDDRSPEEKYAEKLAQLCLSDDGTNVGLKLVRDLLGRCLLWIQIMDEK